MIQAFYVYLLIAIAFGHFFTELSQQFKKNTSYLSSVVYCVLIYFSIHPIIGTSSLYIVKCFILLWTLIRIGLLFVPKDKFNVVLSGILGSIVIVIALLEWLPASYALLINIMLIASSIAYPILLFKKSDRRMTFQLEASAIHLLSVLLITLSGQLVNVQLGIGLIALELLIEIFGILTEEKKGYHQLVDRLETLENKFKRAVQLEAKRLTLPLNDQIHEIHRKTLKDNLTKVENREGLNRAINQHLLDKNVKIFTIAVFDIDFFKKINDNEGHIKGDETLKQLVTTIMSDFNKAFTLARYGGDEFVIVMPNINAPKAIDIMKDICRKVSQTGITISVGIATAPFDGRSQQELFVIADQGLYKAKELGRNQVQYVGNVPIVTPLSR